MKCGACGQTLAENGWCKICRKYANKSIAYGTVRPNDPNLICSCGKRGKLIKTTDGETVKCYWCCYKKDKNDNKINPIIINDKYELVYKVLMEEENISNFYGEKIGQETETLIAEAMLMFKSKGSYAKTWEKYGDFGMRLRERYVNAYRRIIKAYEEKIIEANINAAV